MNKTIGSIIILLIFGVYAAKTFVAHQKKLEIKKEATFSKVKASAYWTCPMHPQIHSDKPGECPICHMQLVQVKEQKKVLQKNEQKSQRSEVQITEDQIGLVGIHKVKVEKMSLVVQLPVSGRLISSSTVAFQIYESDIRTIKIGTSFKGRATFMPELELEGMITYVDNIVDSSSRTIRVVGALKKNLPQIALESSFKGHIEIELKDRLAIPENSVLHTGEEDIVYLMDNNLKLQAKKIILGLKANGFYEVLSGLSLNDEISSGPNFLIDSEAKIRGANQ